MTLLVRQGAVEMARPERTLRFLEIFISSGWGSYGGQPVSLFSFLRMLEKRALRESAPCYDEQTATLGNLACSV